MKQRKLLTKERIIILHCACHFSSSFKGHEDLLFINHCATCKGIQDSLGLWTPRHGFQIPDSRYLIPVFALDFNR